MVEVELLNWSGRESVKIVANACRITASELDHADDRKIIDMLVENDYTSAIEHIWFTFKIRCSIVCQRELLEHRIASHTTRSTRYCDENLKESFVIPCELREEDLYALDELLERIQKTYEDFKEKYGREYSRYLLPLGLQTEFVWTINARSLVNFLGLRLCIRAAPEIRELAKKIHEIVKELVPEIFEKVGCRGVTFGICLENEARPKNCPYRSKILSKRDLKDLLM